MSDRLLRDIDAKYNWAVAQLACPECHRLGQYRATLEYGFIEDRPSHPGDTIDTLGGNPFLPVAPLPPRGGATLVTAPSRPLVP